MKTKFFKIATIIAFGAVSFLSSCDKEEIDNESPAVNMLDAESFQNLLDEIKNDTNVISYSVTDANKINEELRSQSGGNYVYPYYFSDLMAYSKSSKPGSTLKTTHGNYGRIDMDLNMGAGGAYVYLYYQVTSVPSNAISYIDGYYNTTSYKAGSSMVIDGATGDVADCNRGTKGGKIALGIRKGDSKRRMNCIAIVAYKSAKNGYYQGLRRVADDLDLNKGAGGRYIYIFAGYGD